MRVQGFKSLRVQGARNKLLAAVFAKAAKMGISQEEVRDDIAPSIIKKRLSEADNKEVFRVLEHVVKLQGQRVRESEGQRKRYEPSRKGLLQELEDAAKQRWGSGFERPLSAFINSHLKTPTHYKFLNVGFMKAVKERLKELNELDRRNTNQRPA